MAGGGDQKENPVAINVVPMVDVIFCLCVFFMCSLKFKQLEGMFDSWLPRDKGASGPSTVTDLIQEIRVAMTWDEGEGRTVRRIGDARFDDDAELERVLRDARADFVRLGKPDVPVTIDGAAGVPWQDVVDVVNLCKRNQLERIEFAFGVERKEARTP